MAYTALYRKLRSQKFTDMIGQEHIVRTLKNQITSGRVSHAYLFCGIRGTGKTTAARILSRAVNCENPQNGEPCNECAACLDILKERSMNVSEIDAASNNGVENVRDIIEDCYYPPTSGSYKVYIIDEVHMLSASAFNALLKTLEEPPEHVVFILATTDPQKIPVTIHSRCQRFDFKRITSADITGYLKKYTESENVDITEDALKYIASVSDGAMRDALNILEQCISFYFDVKITLEKVQELLGAVDTSVFFDLTDALCTFNSTECMKIIEDIVMSGRDISQFAAGCLSHFRNILVCAKSGEEHSIVEASAENLKRLREQGEKIETNILILYINTFAELIGKLKYMPNERAMLEVTCIKLCSPAASDSYEALFSRIRQLEQYVEEGRFVAAEKKTLDINPVEEISNAKKIKNESKQIPKKEELEIIQKIENSWQSFASEFEPLDSQMLINSSVKYSDGKLNIIFTDKISADILKKKSELIEKKLLEIFNTNIPIIFTWNKEPKKASGKPDNDIDDLLNKATGLIDYDIEYE